MSNGKLVFHARSNEGDGEEMGKSAAVRIPASVMQAMHLDLDEVGCA
jgi:hypothetical protein